MFLCVHTQCFSKVVPFTSHVENNEPVKWEVISPFQQNYIALQFNALFCKSTAFLIRVDKQFNN